MAYTKPWGDDEIEILKAHYAKNGPFWVGWDAYLPDRTDSAIMRKANAIGLRSNVQRFGRDEGGDRRCNDDRPDPVDGMVMRMMRQGMTPSEIDERLHWYRGTAIRVITGIWKGSR